jgi:hypothetical protein
MSLQRIVLSVLVVSLSMVGLTCGLLCLLFLTTYVLLHGLGVGSAVLALLCLSCLGLAVILSGRVAKREAKRLSGSRLRSLKTWWRSREAGGAPALYAEPDRGAYHLEPGGTGALPPLREAENWPEDLQRYGDRSEPPENIGNQHRKR